MDRMKKTLQAVRKLGVICMVAVVFQAAGTAQSAQSAQTEIDKRVETLLGKLTLDEKIVLLGGVNDFFTQPIPRVGIPSLKMSDGPMGVHDYGPTTAYPAGIALAASWDEELAKRVGISMGKDARARGVHIILAPGMNIYRSPLNGRNFEYFGEDPFLASRMAVGVIEGIQSQGVVATAKHFIANNSEYGRMDHSSDMDERTMREIYLPAFEASIKEAKVGAVMDAYNLVNGVHMTQNGLLNETIARKEWGFRGIMMSDWEATHDGIGAANNGLDLEMPSAAHVNAKALLPALQRGDVTLATIDEKIRRILRTAIQFGFLDRPQLDSSVPLYSQAGRQIALEEARNGMVLLKNDRHSLPLDRQKLRTIAVLGPNAYPSVVGGGGSSLTAPYNSLSFLEGISNAGGSNLQVLSVFETPSIDAIVGQTEFVTAPGGKPGLRGEYFANAEFQGAPMLVRTDERIDFRWGDGSFAEGAPVDHFAVRWSGYFVPKTEDDYRFYSSADDGVRLFIDDELAIDDWKPHAETLNTCLRHLQAGRAYKLRLEFFENIGTATVRFGIGTASLQFSEETKKIAAAADAVILCMGFGPNTESEGFDRPFRLPKGQDEFIEQAAAINKNVVVVLNAGGNLDMSRWLDKVPALLMAWYPGQEGGRALAQVLYGEYSPSGKLPATFERKWEDNPVFRSYFPQKGDKHVEYTEGIFVGYRGYEKNGVKPQFPFGFGLSYTTFGYSDLRMETPDKSTGAVVDVSFQVENTGDREGAEIAEVYVGDPQNGPPRPVKELRGFVKINLKPGEKKHVNVQLDRRAFSCYDAVKHAWTAPPGEYGVLVGSSSADIRLKGNYIFARQ
ncbi:MAG TPA: glycoside hydrolase family 3 C-terminal domain-containing protein [Candidatus Limnocylindrales bacterium]|nr:glycoside hydrolase family 3 C-terminal domain-containing protein [Candidatus Limnocylindrales bacterium]